MQFSPNDMLSPNIILSDVLLELQDESMRKFNKGWYMSQIQQCLEELGFDSFFHTSTQDFDFPSNMKLEYPTGCFNLREIYVLSVTDCTINDQKNVYWKRRFTTNGNGKGYTAQNKDGIQDPFISGYGSDSTEYFFSVYNGIIHFSDACANYNKVRLVFNGIIGDIGDVPFVPRIFRQVTKSWVLRAAYAVLKNREPKIYRPMYLDQHNILMTPITGEWDKAISRVKAIDSKMLRDMKEYNSKMNY